MKSAWATQTVSSVGLGANIDLAAGEKLGWFEGYALNGLSYALRVTLSVGDGAAAVSIVKDYFGVAVGQRINLSKDFPQITSSSTFGDTTEGSISIRVSNPNSASQSLNGFLCLYS